MKKSIISKIQEHEDLVTRPSFMGEINNSESTKEKEFEETAKGAVPQKLLEKIKLVKEIVLSQLKVNNKNLHELPSLDINIIEKDSVVETNDLLVKENSDVALERDILIAENKSLRSKMENIQSKKQTIERNYQLILETNEVLKKENEMLKKNYSKGNLEDVLDDNSELFLIKKLEETIIHERKSLGEMVNKIETIHSNCFQDSYVLRNDYEDTVESLEYSRKINNSLSSQLTNIKKTIEEKVKENISLKSQLNTLETKEKWFNTITLENKKLFDSLKHSHDSLRNELNNERKKNINLTLENNNAEKSIEESTNRLKESIKQISFLENYIKDIEKVNEEKENRILSLEKLKRDSTPDSNISEVNKNKEESEHSDSTNTKVTYDDSEQQISNEMDTEKNNDEEVPQKQLKRSMLKRKDSMLVTILKSINEEKRTSGSEENNSTALNSSDVVESPHNIKKSKKNNNHCGYCEDKPFGLMLRCNDCSNTFHSKCLKTEYSKKAITKYNKNTCFECFDLKNS